MHHALHSSHYYRRRRRRQRVETVTAVHSTTNQSHCHHHHRQHRMVWWVTADRPHSLLSSLNQIQHSVNRRVTATRDAVCWVLSGSDCHPLQLRADWSAA